MTLDRHSLRETLHQPLSSCLAAAGVIGFGLLLATLPRPVQASSKQAQAAGAAVFREKGCQHCHGVDATGTDRGPDLSTVGKTWRKDRIEQQIREGGNGMPAFGDALQADEIKSLVDFLSAKRKATKTPPSSSNKPGSPAKPAPNPSSDDSGQ